MLETKLRWTLRLRSLPELRLESGRAADKRVFAGSCAASTTAPNEAPLSATVKEGRMNAAITLLLLLVAACLEVGGDAIVRVGRKSYTGLSQLALLAVGGGVLLGYGVFVNTAPADFGRLLGVYVVLFFIVAQVANLCVFGIRPDAPILVGGAMIFGGGLLITLWKP
jgi:small multidrug resistance family-3 protein